MSNAPLPVTSGVLQHDPRTAPLPPSRALPTGPRLATIPAPGAALFQCLPCARSIATRDTAKHLGGQPHRAAVAALARRNAAVEKQQRQKQYETWECVVCQREMTLSTKAAHLDGAPHGKMMVAKKVKEENAQREKERERERAAAKEREVEVELVMARKREEESREDERERAVVGGLQAAAELVVYRQKQYNMWQCVVCQREMMLSTRVAHLNGAPHGKMVVIGKLKEEKAAREKERERAAVKQREAAAELVMALKQKEEARAAERERERAAVIEREELVMALKREEEARAAEREWEREKVAIKEREELVMTLKREEEARAAEREAAAEKEREAAAELVMALKREEDARAAERERERERVAIKEREELVIALKREEEARVVEREKERERKAAAEKEREVAAGLVAALKQEEDSRAAEKERADRAREEAERLQTEIERREGERLVELQHATKENQAQIENEAEEARQKERVKAEADWEEVADIGQSQHTVLVGTERNPKREKQKNKVQKATRRNTAVTRRTIPRSSIGPVSGNGTGEGEGLRSKMLDFLHAQEIPKEEGVDSAPVETADLKRAIVYGQMGTLPMLITSITDLPPVLYRVYDSTSASQYTSKGFTASVPSMPYDPVSFRSMVERHANMSSRNGTPFVSVTSSPATAGWHIAQKQSTGLPTTVMVALIDSAALLRGSHVWGMHDAMDHLGLLPSTCKRHVYDNEYICAVNIPASAIFACCQPEYYKDIAYVFLKKLERRNALLAGHRGRMVVTIRAPDADAEEAVAHSDSLLCN